VDQFHHVYGLADAGTTEQAHFATLREGTYKVNYLDAGFEQFFGGSLFSEGWGFAVNGHAFFFADRTTLVDRVAEYIHDTAERFGANGHRNRRTGTGNRKTAAETLGRAHCDGAYDAITQLLL